MTAGQAAASESSEAGVGDGSPDSDSLALQLSAAILQSQSAVVLNHLCSIAMHRCDWLCRWHRLGCVFVQTCRPWPVCCSVRSPRCGPGCTLQTADVASVPAPAPPDKSEAVTPRNKLPAAVTPAHRTTTAVEDCLSEGDTGTSERPHRHQRQAASRSTQPSARWHHLGSPAGHGTCVVLEAAAAVT